MQVQDTSKVSPQDQRPKIRRGLLVAAAVFMVVVIAVGASVALFRSDSTGSAEPTTTTSTAPAPTTSIEATPTPSSLAIDDPSRASNEVIADIKQVTDCTELLAIMDRNEARFHRNRDKNLEDEAWNNTLYQREADLRMLEIGC